ncbi:dimethylarginine dimethylaminohydrolase family protein [Niallia sp. 01092]|uniref:dimethylarginine dimethylaminohydrolase family protein n=1 Tax=unclassified Niallia TaxID=2837522 RepID=UPI003FD47C4C
MIDESMKICCASEYHPLKKVVLTSPTYMTIKEPINAIQEQYFQENINTQKAEQQHGIFVEKLKEHGVEVTLLPPFKKYPEQVFTRDIGFILGMHVFVSEMGHDVRKGEENTFLRWLEKENITYTNLKGDKMEGGDVLIDQNTIYVGVSNRTNKKAIEHLQTLLPTYEVIAVPFTDTFLHLDCVFNILSPTEALIYRGEIDKEVEKLLAERYELIEVSKEEQATLGTNVLSIGDKKVFSLPINKGVNKELKKRDYTIIEVDISEIIKSGGAFRCCTLPLKRL